MSTWSSRSSCDRRVFALTCGALRLRGCAAGSGVAAIALFVACRSSSWVAAFAAIAAEFHGAERLRDVRVPTARTVHYACPRSHSSRRRSSSRSRRSRMLVSRGSRWRAAARLRTRISAVDGERVQASRPRRGPHRGRGRPLARLGGPGDRRGRPARRDPDRQGDRRDPVAVRRDGAAGSSSPKARSCRSGPSSSSSASRRELDVGDEPPGRLTARRRQDDRRRRPDAQQGRACRRRPSCAGSRRSSASISPRSPGPARTAGSPRTTSARRRRPERGAA